MPPRWFVGCIVIFWLATAVLFFRREFWPYWQPGAPPPFAIDLIDEARDNNPVNWEVLHNGQHVLDGSTIIEHEPRANTFTLRAAFHYHTPRRGEKISPQNPTIYTLNSMYQVTPEGQLLALRAEVSLNYHVGMAALDVPLYARVDGTVAQGQFNASYEFAVPGNSARTGNLPSVPVSANGSVIMLMHPVHHIRGVRPGQSWRVPEIDPIRDALAALTPGVKAQSGVLQASVLPEPQWLHGQDREPVECLVISYLGDELTGRTWIRRADDVVLRQEVSEGNDTWALNRQ